MCGLVEGHTCAPLNTCEESRRTKRIARAWTKEDSWRSCSRPPVKYLKTVNSQPGLPPPVEIPTEPPWEPEETSRDDLDIVMDAIEPSDPSEGAGEAAWSTETEVQSSPWKDWERVLDSMPWVRLPSRRPLEVLDLKRLVWRRGTGGKC